MFSVSYKTESGDEGLVGLFTRKLTEQELYGWLLDNMPDGIVTDEYEGRIEHTCYVFFDQQHCELSLPPTPVNLPEYFSYL